MAEFEAARLLGLELTDARTAGYDATRRRNGRTYRLQVKGRCVLPGASKSQRMGGIDVKKKFEGVLLVLMDASLEATAIYEASRASVVKAIAAPGSKARNERGALPVSKFKAIGKCVWKRDDSVKGAKRRR